MTRQSPQLTLRIDHVIADRPGLDQAALENSLRDELGRLLADQGVLSLGRGGYRPQVEADLPLGQGSLAARVASATVKAVKP